MTTPCEPVTGRAAGSQVRGVASPWAESPEDYAWNVNFYNGNANYNDRDNNGWARAVRSVSAAGECRGAVSLKSLYDAWQRARRKKRPSRNQVAFETRWMDRLLQLQRRLVDGTWCPAPSACFIARAPKAREIHAPDFGDRVVHHWLVPQLEAVIEPTFIHDSFSNRRGKGTHAAVERLRSFVRQVASGEGGGWYLQLDIRNFFNSIHRPTLWADIKRRMARSRLPIVVQRVAHALLRRPPLSAGVIHHATPAERALVPRHKRLEASPPGCGLPIGNLSSQFFANCYLDALDQFVKHTLRAKRYVRFVDDFVLVHRDRAQLEQWKGQIEHFLRTRLRLELKADVRLRPLQAGVDFLGYVVRPSHLVVRRRVLAHAHDALRAWGRGHVAGDVVTARPDALRAPRDRRDLAQLPRPRAPRERLARRGALAPHLPLAGRGRPAASLPPSPGAHRASNPVRSHPCLTSTKFTASRSRRASRSTGASSTPTPPPRC